MSLRGNDFHIAVLLNVIYFTDRKIPKVSGQAEGYPAELAEPGYGARVCISRTGLRGGLESDVESHRG